MHDFLYLCTIITDMDGNFQINVKAGTKVKISYEGFESQTVTVKNGMRITLAEDSKTTLKGVEVVAYGVQKKVSVTGGIYRGRIVTCIHSTEHFVVTVKSAETTYKTSDKSRSPRTALPAKQSA